jgi:hypothetical protein
MAFLSAIAFSMNNYQQKRQTSKYSTTTFP